MADLTMEVGRLNDIAVDNADGPDAGAGDVLSCWTPQATGSDYEHARVNQP
jgi:hypothetical protein